jgi:hypothetical protein
MEITPIVLEPQVRVRNEETIVKGNSEEQATPTREMICCR